MSFTLMTVYTTMRNTRWLSLMILCTGFLLIVVDMTIVNVALPSIQRDLGFSQSGLAWVINGYLIAFAGLLLLAGRLGDLLGRARLSCWARHLRRCLGALRSVL